MTTSQAQHESAQGHFGAARLAIPVLGLGLLGAHALRLGDFWTVAALSCLLGVCLCRQGWARLVAGAALFVGSLVWVKIGVSFIQLRMAVGQDWVRLACILSGVALFSFAGAMLLWSHGARARYTRNASTAVPQAITFCLVAILLWICREKVVRFPLLLADRFFPGSGVLEIILVAFYAAVVCGRLLDTGKIRTVRPALWAFFSAVFFGQFLSGLAGAERLLMTGDLHLPVPALIIAGPLFRGGGYFMPILFAVSVLLVGPAWCSHLCYIGAWDDRMSRLGKKGACSKQLLALLRRARWGIALGCFGTAIGLRLTGVPFAVAVWSAAAFGLVGFGIMVFFSARAGVMMHCSFFCPLGLVSNLLGAISPWRLRINSRCTQCGACQRVCRYNALSDADLVRGRPALSCSLCRDCTAVCAHGAMDFTLPFVSSGVAVRLFVIVVASLHAVFLAVARM